MKMEIHTQQAGSVKREKGQTSPVPDSRKCEKDLNALGVALWPA